MFVDLSRTFLGDDLAVGENSGGIVLCDKDTDAPITGVDIGTVFDTFGWDRIDLLKYGSPARSARDGPQKRG